MEKNPRHHECGGFFEGAGLAWRKILDAAPESAARGISLLP
jgi:hypothetical protein